MILLSLIHQQIVIVDSAKSYNFELHPSEEYDLVVKILTYAGVVIKQADVAGFAQGKEQQIAATEQ